MEGSLFANSLRIDTPYLSQMKISRSTPQRSRKIHVALVEAANKAPYSCSPYKMLLDTRPATLPTPTPSRTTSLFPQYFEPQPEILTPSNTEIEKTANELENKIIPSIAVDDSKSTVSDIGDTRGISLSTDNRSNVTPSSFSGELIAIPKDRPVTPAQLLTTNRDDCSDIPSAATPSPGPVTPTQQTLEGFETHLECQVKYTRDKSSAIRDPMDFSLLVDGNFRTRSATADELDAIYRTFPTCTQIKVRSSIMILKCITAPNNIPLTVAGLPAVFLPIDDDYEPIPGSPGNPRIADITFDPFNPKEETPFNFLDRVNDWITVMGYKPINASLYLGELVIGLETDMPQHMLPGRLGGFIPFYCIGSRAFKGRPIARSRLIEPREDVSDDANYRSRGLTPGVRVSGRSKSGTSGVVIVNKVTGARRITVANHVFDDTSDVFHPVTLPGCHIGVIKERYPDLDVALVELDEDVAYSNNTYFTADIPRRLTTANSLHHQALAPSDRSAMSWYSFDSPFTGNVPLVYTGWDSSPRAEADTHVHHHLKYMHSYMLMNNVGINLDRLRDEVCGSPIVIDSYDLDPEDQGDVLGFFAYTDQNVVENVLVPALDLLIDDGWVLEVEG